MTKINHLQEKQVVIRMLKEYDNFKHYVKGVECNCGGDWFRNTGTDGIFMFAFVWSRTKIKNSKWADMSYKYEKLCKKLWK